MQAVQTLLLVAFVLTRELLAPPPGASPCARPVAESPEGAAFRTIFSERVFTRAICRPAATACANGDVPAPGESTCAPLTAGDHRAVVIDTDMGLDDVRAIFALLASRSIDIHGIVTTEGSASIGRGTDNLIGQLESSGNEHVPVLIGRGASRLEPPPWRETANSLGGATFPPPRKTAAKPAHPDALIRLLRKHRGELHYIALGPLGNLALLEEKQPGSLRFLQDIWIPVRRTGGHTFGGWNLTCDGGSTERVIRGAGSIVLVDIESALDIDHGHALSSVEGSSPAARWIGRAAAGAAQGGIHLFMHDELAAAAIVNPALIELDDTTYRLETIHAGDLVLAPSDRGNIRVATLAEPAEAVRLLRHLWAEEAGNHKKFGGDRRPEHGDELHAEHEDDRRPGHGDELHAEHEDDRRPGHENEHYAADQSIAPNVLLKAFHGHLGPYVVLGYRMGRIALETAGVEGHFGITAEVHSILEPPNSCLIDGIQIGSGCTLGKRTIEVIEYDGPAYAVFETEPGDEITVRLRSGVPDLVRRLIDERGVEAAGEELMDRPRDELFDVLTRFTGRQNPRVR